MIPQDVEAKARQEAEARERAEQAAKAQAEKEAKERAEKEAQQQAADEAAKQAEAQRLAEEEYRKQKEYELSKGPRERHPSNVTTETKRPMKPPPPRNKSAEKADSELKQQRDEIKQKTVEEL